MGYTNMKNTDLITKQSDAKPVSIVGIYLTELDLIMVKVKMSNGVYINKQVATLKDLLPEEYSSVCRDLEGWRFVPCCE
jgi:hypothetical protein